MPNWCYTSVKCTGNTEEIQDLYDRMKRLQEMKEPLKPNGFGTTWLGNLVEDLGVDFNKVQCRGSWDCLELDEDILSFTTETAWYRCTEVEDLIKEKYPSIDIAFRCEEPGMAIYEKNNSVFFPEDYIVDIEDDDTYYLMESEALQTLSDFFGIDFKDMAEAMILVRENNDKMTAGYGSIGMSLSDDECQMRKAFCKMDYNKTPFCMLQKGGCVRLI